MLTLEEAERMLAAAKAKAAELNQTMSIAVVDAAGNPVALARMDGAGFITAEIAIAKAFASAAFRRPSGEFNELARQNPAFITGVIGIARGRMLPSQGAVPIVRDNQTIGAIGCSGGPSQMDEDVARAGVAALGGA